MHHSLHVSLWRHSLDDILFLWSTLVEVYWCEEQNILLQLIIVPFSSRGKKFKFPLSEIFVCVFASLKRFPLFIVFSVTEGKITCLLGETGNIAENPFPPQAVARQATGAGLCILLEESPCV